MLHREKNQAFDRNAKSAVFSICIYYFNLLHLQLGTRKPRQDHYSFNHLKKKHSEFKILRLIQLLYRHKCDIFSMSVKTVHAVEITDRFFL